MKVPYSPWARRPDHATWIPRDLQRQLGDTIRDGDFTLGAPVAEFERRFADLVGAKHAVGVGSGTDAIKLSLHALGVGPGDGVVTAANTFVGTVGAIAELGAHPVFVDVDDSFCMDVDLVELEITDTTTAIVPVHLTGAMVNMPRLREIATEIYDLKVVEDACQAVLAGIETPDHDDYQQAGTCTWGNAGAFSLHPLKNLSVWGDGGMVVTDSDHLATQMRLLRNHGLVDRDKAVIMGFNSRLDTLQAVVGNSMIGRTIEITDKRIANAQYYDKLFGQIAGIRVPPRPPGMYQVFHLYIVFAEDRDGLYKHCRGRGVECKIHYPTPLYLQPALRFLGHKPGDFPVTDRHAREMITFPVDEHLTTEQIEYVVETVRRFYKGG